MIRNPPPILSFCLLAAVLVVGAPLCYLLAAPPPRTATQPAAGTGTDAELGHDDYTPQATILARVAALEQAVAALRLDLDVADVEIASLIRENEEIRTMLGGYDTDETPQRRRPPPPKRRAAKPVTKTPTTEESPSQRPPIARNDSERCAATAYSTGNRCKLRATDGNGRCKYHTER